MRRIWGRANSSNVMKLLWLAEELSIPYERVDAGGPFGITDTATYRTMNPNGLVPSLEEDGFTLWESNAILRYLAGEHGAGAPIWPAEPRARARIDQWMDWQQTTLNRPQTVVFLGLIRTKPEQRDTAAIAQGVIAAGKVWGLLDRELAVHPYVVGEALTLADIALGVHVHRWFSFEIERPDTPHLRAWYDRLLGRPAYARHCAQPVT